MNKKMLNARRSSAGAIVALLLAALGFFPGTVHASPADEITKAVLAAGATSVADANAKTFIKGFSSVIVRPKCDDIARYVTAAVKLRPDLVSPITIAAIRAHRRDVPDLSCDCVDPIIRAAILAAPDAKKALVKAAIDSEPWARECIVSASGLSRETETAFFRPPGVDAGNVNGAAIGTINPANVGASGQGNKNTPENDAVTICHDGKTITVSRQGAEAHIRNHPNDHLGPCGP
jgi:hypothetical protein